MDTSPNTVGSKLGVAIVLAHTRLETVTTRQSQCALAVKLVVHGNTTIRRGLSSIRLVETYGSILPSVTLTARFSQPLLSLTSGTLWNYRKQRYVDEGDHQRRP